VLGCGLNCCRRPLHRCCTAFMFNAVAALLSPPQASEVTISSVPPDATEPGFLAVSVWRCVCTARLLDDQPGLA